MLVPRPGPKRESYASACDFTRRAPVRLIDREEQLSPLTLPGQAVAFAARLLLITLGTVAAKTRRAVAPCPRTLDDHHAPTPRSLHHLGMDRNDYKVLNLLPLINVAWATGTIEVAKNERGEPWAELMTELGRHG